MNQIYDKINNFKIDFEKSIENDYSLINLGTLNGLKIALSFLRKELEKSCQNKTKAQRSKMTQTPLEMLNKKLK
jgi:hypothetical protein